MPFWPMLFPDGYTNALFIQKIRVLDNVIILPGRHRENLFDSSPTTNMLALNVAGKLVTICQPGALAYIYIMYAACLGGMQALWW